MKSLRVIGLILVCALVLSSTRVFNAYDFIIYAPVTYAPIRETLAQLDIEQAEGVPDGSILDASISDKSAADSCLENATVKTAKATYELGLESLPVVMDINLEEVPVVSDYEVWELPSSKAIELKAVDIKDADIVYKYIHWDEAQNILTREMKYKVTDVLTGNSWNMIRLGGTNHADSVTLTPEDTAIMHETFGEWTWEPRAVIVDTESGYKMPAALRGMPHDIWSNWNENNFPGHVCLYFYGSRTHISNTELESANLRILEAENFLTSRADFS